MYCWKAVTLASRRRQMWANLGVKRSAGRLVSGLVVAEHHDGVAGVEELGGEGLEVIPFGGETEEDALSNGGMADVGIAVGVREVLRFVPENVPSPKPRRLRPLSTAEDRPRRERLDSI